jgi:hypothetical protein
MRPVHLLQLSSKTRPNKKFGKKLEKTSKKDSILELSHTRRLEDGQSCKMAAIAAPCLACSRSAKTVLAH